MEIQLTPQKKSFFIYIRGLFNPEVYWLFGIYPQPATEDFPNRISKINQNIDTLKCG